MSAAPQRWAPGRVDEWYAVAMSAPIVLSGLHVAPLLRARRAGQATACASLDLGLTLREASLATDGVYFSDGRRISWGAIEEIGAAGSACFVLDDAARKIHVYSSYLDRAYSLMATQGAPTLVNSGFTMHRIVGIDPHEDTLRKVRAVAPLRGEVLDTVTGLGYTAIEAAKSAAHVTTIELDPAVLEVAHLNPWSHALFADPRITQLIGDTFVEIQQLRDGAFTRVIHDPPSFSLAGELYSGLFYRQLYRVLRRGGRLFHYIGRLESRHGQRVATGVLRRLREAGFTRVTRCPDAFGLVAYKDD